MITLATSSLEGMLYIISSTITGNFGLNNYSIIMIATSVLIGGIGGIIGVNRK